MVETPKLIEFSRPMNQSLRQYCLRVIAELEVGGSEFGYLYVHHSMELYRLFKYEPKLNVGLFSSLHGPDFFEVIIRCLDGSEEWEEKGEYGSNFRRFIEHYRKLETIS